MRFLATLLLFAALLTVPLSALTYSSGAPASRAGSPGDDGGETCTECHSSFSLGSGGGSVLISGPDSYLPGETIDLTVTVSKSGASRFGFEVTVVDGGFQHVGTFELVAGTKFAGGNSAFVTHNPAVSVSNSASWAVKWTAPAQAPPPNEGTLTFYAAGNAANGNGNATGDYIYTISHSMNLGSGVATEPELVPSHFRLGAVYPNPLTSTARLPVDLGAAVATRIDVSDEMGRLVRSNDLGVLAAGPRELALPVEGLSAGRYFVTVQAGTNRETRAVMVLR